MAKDNQKSAYKKFVLFVAGFFVLVLGVTLILVWAGDVAALFRGSIGFILALAGVFSMYAVNKVG